MENTITKQLSEKFSKRPSRYRIADITARKLNWNNSGLRLLELGSGDGEASEYLRRMYGLNVTAVEKDPELVAHSGTRKIEGLEYICADVVDFEIPDEHYDVIYTEAFWAACDNAEAVADVCVKALKDGGCLVVNDFIIHNEVDENLRAGVRSIPCFRGVHGMGYWKNFFEQRGFELMEFTEDTDEFLSISVWLSDEFGVDPANLGNCLAETTGEFFRIAEMSYGRMIFTKRG